MAPTISRKRRVTTRQQQDEVPESIFDSISPMMQLPSERQAPRRAKEPEPKGPTMEELMAKMDALAAENERVRQANDALTRKVEVPTTPQEPKFSLEGLPDPVTDPTGYAKALSERTGKYSQDVHAYQTQVSDNRSKEQQRQTSEAEVLWDDFAALYGTYASDEERMEVVTSLVTKAANKRGLDVNRYMYQNRDRFFKDLASKYDSLFGKPEEEPEVVLEPQRRAAPKQERDDDPGRTDGIFGGIDQGPARGSAGVPKAGDMVKDLQDLQRQSGYF